MDFNQRVAHERLTKICFIDYDHEIALVAERPLPDAKDTEILGVGRLVKSRDKKDAEFAVLIVDHAQRQGTRRHAATPHHRHRARRKAENRGRLHSRPKIRVS